MGQAPLSMEFFRQEYWSGFPFPSPGYLPDPGIDPGSPALHEDSLPSEPQVIVIATVCCTCVGGILLSAFHARGLPYCLWMDEKTSEN